MSLLRHFRQTEEWRYVDRITFSSADLGNRQIGRSNERTQFRGDWLLLPLLGMAAVVGVVGYLDKTWAPTCRRRGRRGKSVAVSDEAVRKTRRVGFKASCDYLGIR